MRKKKKIINLISKFVAFFSFVIWIVFSLYLFRLNMLPDKYIFLFLTITGVIYSIFYLLLLPKKVKAKFKIISMLLLICFSFVFVSGIVYVDKTISFIDKINDRISQKKEYYVYTNSNSLIKQESDLNGKKIGVYSGGSTENITKAISKLKDKISFEVIQFKNVAEMFEELIDEKIDAVLVNDAVLSVIDTDLSYLKLDMKKITSVFVNIENVETVKIVDVTNTSFNVYVAGGDSYGTIDKVTNTDVNMIVSINPNTNKILITSIPRDYYVNLVGLDEPNAFDKLTHAGYYGIETSIKTIEKLLDIDINYYIKINFSTVEDLINIIDGVDVYSDYSFCANGLPDVCYNQGVLHLNGFRALMFARERMAFKDGDLQRVKNQQKILTALINKVSSSTSLITSYTSILDSISESFSTNFDSNSISRLVKKQLNNMNGWTINQQSLTGTDLYTEETYTFPGTKLYVMQKDNEVIKEVSDKIKVFVKEK